MRWTTGDIAGISRFSIQLVRALHARPDVEVTALVCSDEQAELIPEVPQIRAHDPQGPGAFVLEMLLPRRLNRLRPDIVYSPIFYTGWVRRQYRLVLTIHDMIPFHFPRAPQYVGRLGRVGWRVFYATKWPLRFLLTRADRIATVSETARAEIERDLIKGAVAVIPNSVEQVARPAASDRSANTDIVYMGVFSQHKNVETLISALALLPEIRLHLLSRIPKERRVELESFARDRGVLDRVVIHGGVTDDEYRDLLARARCLITASRLEGFGLPIIEAQQQGVPVACSEISIFREVAGDAAEFFDPIDAAGCAAAIERLGVRDRSLELAHAGVLNAERFTAEASADAAMRLFREAVGR